MKCQHPCPGFELGSPIPFTLTITCPVEWGRRIHRLLLCIGVRPQPPTSIMIYDTIKIWWWGSNNAGDLGNAEYPFVPSLPGSPWPGEVAPDRVLSMGQIELNYVLMLHWIAWNRAVLTFILRTYATLNCLKRNCFCMLNWTVWNRTAFKIETVFALNWIIWNRTVLTWNCVSTKNFTYIKLNCLK